MKRFWLALGAVLALALPVPGPAAGAEGNFDDAPDYTARSADLQGTLTAIGSDTLGEVMDNWAAAFAAIHPNVQPDIESEGSQTAPPALSAGRTKIAPMSRPMSRGEEATFENQYGYQPTEVTVALDALAVYVHKDNPIYGLTMGQLDQIFSSSHLCGGRPITRWDELAVGTRTLEDISVHGRDTRSGTYEYFRDKALCDGAFREDYIPHEDSRAVIKAVAADVNAIGFAGLGYNEPNVRPIALARGSDPQYVRFFPIYVERFKNSDDASKRFAYVLDGRYPLARRLYLYVNREPGEPMDDLTREFLSFVLSRQGQQIVVDRGYVPLPSRTLERERRKLAADYQPRRWWFD